MAVVTGSSLREHPDAAEMTARYEKIAHSGPAVTVDGLVMLAGLFLAISPWVVGFDLVAPDVAVNNLVLGIALAALGLFMAMFPERVFGLAWTIVPIGAWVIISTWVVGTTADPPDRVIWTNVFTGAAIVLLGLLASGLMVAATARSRTGERDRYPGGGHPEQRYGGEYGPGDRIADTQAREAHSGR